MTQHARRLDEATIRRLAVESSTDPRTVRKVLRGEPVRGMPRERILEALRSRGLAVGPSIGDHVPPGPMAGSGGPLA